MNEAVTRTQETGRSRPVEPLERVRDAGSAGAQRPAPFGSPFPDPFPTEGAGGPSRTQAKRLRLGFAGIGWIGRNRLDAMAANLPVDVVAVVDPAPAACANAVAAFPGVRCESDFDALLEFDLDGIVIATPSALHAAQSIAALRRGRAVFCQKPLARTAAEVASVIEAARSADRLLGVDFSYRFTAGMQSIRDLIRRGELGEIYAIEGVFHNAYGPDKPWFYDPQSSGGGCLLDLGIHLIDLALWCLGFPRVESAHGLTRRHDLRPFHPGPKVEDYACGQIEFAGGTTMQLACSWRAPAGCDARIELTFFGTHGGATFRNVDGSFYDFAAHHLLPDRRRRLLATPPDAWGGRAAIAWASQLAESPRFDPAVAHVGSVAAALDRLYGR